MDAKDFFRPTGLKIGVFFVLVIMLIISILGMRAVIWCFMAPCNQPWYVELSAYIFSTLGFFLYVFVYGTMHYPPFSEIFGTAAEAFFLYMLSCTINNVYRKFVKR